MANFELCTEQTPFGPHAMDEHYWINTQSACCCGWGYGDLSDDLDFTAHLAAVADRNVIGERKQWTPKTSTTN